VAKKTLAAVFILRGIPGSGKSTFAARWGKVYSNSGLKVRIFSADNYFMRKGVYKFDGAKLGAAHRKCLRDFAECLRLKRANIYIVDNTNITAVEAAPYVALASAYLASCRVVTIAVAARKAAKRNVHGVPRKAVLAKARLLQEETERFPGFWTHHTIKSR
jgi:predicted kinase